MKGVIEIIIKFIFEKVPSVNNSGSVANFVKAKRETLNATPLLPYVEGRNLEALILNYNSARDCGNEFKGIIDAVKGICCGDDRLVIDIRIRNVGDSLSTESDITELYISDSPIPYPYGKDVKEIKADCTVDFRGCWTSDGARTREQELEICGKFVQLFPALAARAYLTGNFPELATKYRETIGSPCSGLKQKDLEDIVTREVEKSFRIEGLVDRFCFVHASGMSAPMKQKGKSYPLISGQCFESTGMKVKAEELQKRINASYHKLQAFRRMYSLEGENYLADVLKGSWKGGHIGTEKRAMIFRKYLRRGYSPVISALNIKNFIEMAEEAASKYPCIVPCAAVRVEWRNEDMAQPPKEVQENELLDLEKDDVKEEIYETVTEKELFSPELEEPEFSADDEWKTLGFKQETENKCSGEGVIESYETFSEDKLLEPITEEEDWETADPVQDGCLKEDIVIKALSFALLKELQEIMQEGR